MSTLKVNNLQAESGNTITINSGDKISGAAGSIVAPGQVLQCVQYYAASPGAQSTSSTSFVATGIKKTITPKASGNLIIIQTHISMAYASASAYARIYLNGSAMAGSENYHMGYSISFMFSDVHYCLVRIYPVRIQLIVFYIHALI